MGFKISTDESNASSRLICWDVITNLPHVPVMKYDVTDVSFDGTGLLEQLLNLYQGISDFRVKTLSSI
ncbi:hypothetical protein J6590_087589, partial [Homalodisca vitripennis]